MDQKFKNEYLGEFPVDQEYEFMVQAWIVYHKAADLVDGHITVAQNDEERDLNVKAVLAGTHAMTRFAIAHLTPTEIRNLRKNRKKFQSAKLEALRRMEHGTKNK